MVDKFKLHNILSDEEEEEGEELDSCESNSNVAELSLYPSPDMEMWKIMGLLFYLTRRI